MQKQKKWKKRFKILALGLIVSVSLNVSLLTFFFTGFLKEIKALKPFELKTSVVTASSQEERGLALTIDNFSKLSFTELISLLSSKEQVEEGYTEQDIALSCLVKYHHFNLEKALPGKMQKRAILLSKEGQSPQKVLFFPGLSADQFELINQYACIEKWPLTSNGLFSLLQTRGLADESLMKSFFHSKEFEWLEVLFDRFKVKIDSIELLQILLSKDFSYLKNFIKENGEVSDLTIRKFLLGYVFQGSPKACELLLKTDFIFAVKKLDDRTILHILSLLEEISEDVEQFCFELIKSSRSDGVWKKSAEILYKTIEKPLPEPYDHNQVLKQFVFTDSLKEKWAEENPQKLPVKISTDKKITLYKVKEGDTLWKIARRFKIDVDKLLEANSLATDRIHPGSEIVIPE